MDKDKITKFEVAMYIIAMIVILFGMAIVVTIF